ncbi:MAG: hypothetical protein WCV85_02755 [Patescibacteria group bacterium]
MSETFFQEFDQKITAFASKGKIRLGMGLASPDDAILNSLKQVEQYAQITLVGPASIQGLKDFPVIVDPEPEVRLATLLAKGEFDAIIRGTVDDFKTYEKYTELTGEKYTFAPALLASPNGFHFFLTSASNPENWQKEDRLLSSSQIAGFLQSWDVTPNLAVFSGERHETYPRKKHIREGVVGILNQTYEDAEWIVKELQAQGFQAKHWAIDLNPAIEAGANIICPVNGMVGNQVFRVLLFCGGKILFGTRLGLSKLYEDNSRTEKDFSYHVKWLAALVNKQAYA